MRLSEYCKPRGHGIMPWPLGFYSFAGRAAKAAAGLCLRDGLCAEIAADGLVIHARGALAALRRGPGLVIAAVGEEALLGQNGRAGGLFQNAEAFFLTHAGVALSTIFLLLP